MTLPIKRFNVSTNSFIDCLLLPNDENLILHLEKGETVTMPAESLIVYTNYDY